MEDAPEKQPVRVTILSRPYTLLATGDPREVEAVAASVDELMLSIAAKAPNADSTRIAVLACLHLADKLRTIERDSACLQERVDRKSVEFAGMLERPGARGGAPMMAECSWRRWLARPSSRPPRTRPRSTNGESARGRLAARWWLAHRDRPLLAARGRQPFRHGSAKARSFSRMDPRTPACSRCTTARSPPPWTARERELAPDSDDVLKVGRLSLFVIKRGDRYGIRMKDPESQYLREFHGLEYFPANEAYRVDGQVRRRAAQDSHPERPGPDRAGRVPRLRRVPLARPAICASIPCSKSRAPKQLFFIFRDLTSGKETYAGRPLSLLRFAARRQGGAGFQQGLQPALRLHPLRHLPAAAQGESPSRAGRSRREKYGH